MLYFLLVIIAIGVLLISPGGKKILKWVAVSAAVGAILIVVGVVLFWIWGYNQILAAIVGLFILGVVLRMFGLHKE